ncbi:MAG: lysophospholipid acyltransferase family protein [bacterium]
MKETPLWYHLLRELAIIIFKSLFDIKIQGKENIPLKGGAIVASNHLSYLDPIVIGLLVPRKINFMAKRELFENFLFGCFISKLGAFPVRRERLDRKTYQRASGLLKRGKILVLFPEGTRSRGGDLGPLREGTARIAVRTKVPLIPVVIRGTDKALPRGKKMIRLAKIKVRIGKPLESDPLYEGRDIKKGVQILHQRLEKSMKNLIERL